MLEERNSHERDGKKKNTYTYTSVTRLLNMYCPFQVPDAHMRAQMLLGTELHNDIDSFYNNNQYVNTSREFFQFRQFAEYASDVLDLEPYRTEWNVYDDDFMLSGTIDMIYRKRTDPFIFYLYDWKRSRNISAEHANRYTLQLNLYRHILEKNYGIKINKIFLVHFHPCNLNYQIVSISEKKVTKYLNRASELHYLNEISQQETILSKRKRCDNDDCNPMKYMVGSGRRTRRKIRPKKKSYCRTSKKMMHLSSNKQYISRYQN